MMARDAFVSWFKMFVRLESIFDAVPDEAAGRALKASFVYARTGEVPELDQVAMILFSAIKPSIDDSAETFENISQRNRENGKRGGRPSAQHKNPEKPKETQITQMNPENPEKTEVRSKKIEDRSKKTEDRSKENERGTLAASSARHFTPPGEDDVIAFFGEQGSGEQEANSFYDHYTANGWKMGRGIQIKDWKAAARNWIRRSGEYGNGKRPESGKAYSYPSITDGFV